jgi:hypothetical protein
MPPVGSTQKCFCGYECFAKDGPGYCPKHMEMCPHQAKNHKDDAYYVYKDSCSSHKKPCEACVSAKEAQQANEKKNREEEEKKRKKKQDKKSLNPPREKERKKPGTKAGK